VILLEQDNDPNEAVNIDLMADFYEPIQTIKQIGSYFINFHHYRLLLFECWALELVKKNIIL
jgi:hypothetical protein